MKPVQTDHARDRFAQMRRAVDAGGQQQMPDDGSFRLIQDQCEDWEARRREALKREQERAEAEQRQGRLF